MAVCVGMRTRARWLVLAALGGVSCATGSDDPTTTVIVLGDATGDDDNGDDGPAVTDTSATAGTTTNSSASGQVDGTAADTTGVGMGTTTTPADESSGGPPPVCPPEADDVPCEVCGKEQCCAEFIACTSEVECDCALACFLADLPTSDCLVMCGATPAALELFTCAAAVCSDVC